MVDFLYFQTWKGLNFWKSNSYPQQRRHRRPVPRLWPVKEKVKSAIWHNHSFLSTSLLPPIFKKLIKIFHCERVSEPTRERAWFCERCRLFKDSISPDGNWWKIWKTVAAVADIERKKEITDEKKKDIQLSKRFLKISKDRNMFRPKQCD